MQFKFLPLVFSLGLLAQLAFTNSADSLTDSMIDFDLDQEIHKALLSSADSDDVIPEPCNCSGPECPCENLRHLEEVTLTEDATKLFDFLRSKDAEYPVIVESSKRRLSQTTESITEKDFKKSDVMFNPDPEDYEHFNKLQNMSYEEQLNYLKRSDANAEVYLEDVDLAAFIENYDDEKNPGATISTKAIGIAAGAGGIIIGGLGVGYLIYRRRRRPLTIEGEFQ